MQRGNQMQPLSARELAILNRLATDFGSYRQIARDLGISEAAMRVHVIRLFRKIGVNSRSDARMWARDNLQECDRDRKKLDAPTDILSDRDSYARNLRMRIRVSLVMFFGFSSGYVDTCVVF